LTRRKQNRELDDKAVLYATSEDFRRLFADNLDSLYQLAFLLTRDHDTAEQCFVTGVEDSVHGNNVFKEWAHSWAKRTIVQLAIRVLQPKPFDPDSVEDTPAHGDLKGVPDRHDVIGRLLSLGDFDRFVFVMSMLERYSEHECALLLGCTPPDVREARTRALQQITVERPPRTEQDLFADEVASGAGGSHHA
jgi:DNA-directed RNA polymerase specialized sigma24 family protein